MILDLRLTRMQYITNTIQGMINHVVFTQPGSYGQLGLYTRAFTVSNLYEVRKKQDADYDTHCPLQEIKIKYFHF